MAKKEAKYLKEYKNAIYAIGSAVGPHPYPMIVEHFQSIIGKEAKKQFHRFVFRQELFWRNSLHLQTDCLMSDI